jgi:hypothetical protein
MSLYVETWIVRIMSWSQPAHVRDAAAMRSCGMGRSWAESHEHHPAQYLRLSQQEEQEDEYTVRFLLEGLRGRDYQSISLNNPLDTTIMVLSGVGLHYADHGLKIPIPSCWHKKGFS